MPVAINIFAISFHKKRAPVSVPFFYEDGIKSLIT